MDIKSVITKHECMCNAHFWLFSYLIYLRNCYIFLYILCDVKWRFNMIFMIFRCNNWVIFYEDLMIIYSLTWDVLEMWCPVYVLTLMHAFIFKEIFMLGKRGVTAWTYDSTTTMHMFTQLQQSTSTHFNTWLHHQIVTNSM